MLLILVFLCLNHLYATKAAPIQNVTPPEFAPAWVSDPSGRGTWSLLYSCVFTLVLCVWTSVHINIPNFDDSQWIIFRRKMKWVLMGLLAPEIVVYTASFQWLGARDFRKNLQKIYDATQQLGPQRAKTKTKGHKFDMTYGFYAIMGGFAVDISHIHNQATYGTLTPDALLLLAQHGNFHFMTQDSIEDKSKANLFGKGLVCVQVLWVVGQAIERKVAGFPISLLEYHTLVHVFCALVIYALWMQKPYDVQKATIVSTDSYPEALAFIVTSWRSQNGFHHEGTNKPPSKDDPEFAWFGSLVKLPSNSEGFSSGQQNTEGIDQEHESQLELPEQEALMQGENNDPESMRNSSIMQYYQCPKAQWTYLPASGIKPILFLESGQALNSGLGPPYSSSWKTGYRIGLSEKDINRLDMAGSFIRQLVQSLDQPPRVPVSTSDSRGDLKLMKKLTSKPLANPTSGGALRPYGNILLYRRAKNLNHKEILVPFSPLLTYSLDILAFILISGAYGGIHLAAWHYEFPTATEHLLWCISCYVLLVGVVMFWIFINIEDWLSFTDAKDTLFIIFVFIVILPFTMIYIGARAFIVIESFISLRHVPLKVYQTPDTNFMNYVPHL